MAIGLRGSPASATGTNGGNASITYPTGIQANDGIIMIGTWADVAIAVTTPSGFTLVDSLMDAGPNIQTRIWQKVAAGTESGSIAPNYGGVGIKWGLAMIAYSGTDTTSPIQTDTITPLTTAGTSRTSPTVTATGAGCWIIEFAVDRGTHVTGNTWTVPGALSVRAANLLTTGGGSVNLSVADSASTVSAGSNGGHTWTSSLSTSNVNIGSIVLAPAAGGGGGGGGLGQSYAYSITIG